MNAFILGTVNTIRAAAIKAALARIYSPHPITLKGDKDYPMPWTDSGVRYRHTAAILDAMGREIAPAGRRPHYCIWPRPERDRNAPRRRNAKAAAGCHLLVVVDRPRFALACVNKFRAAGRPVYWFDSATGRMVDTEESRVRQHIRTTLSALPAAAQWEPDAWDEAAAATRVRMDEIVNRPGWTPATDAPWNTYLTAEDTACDVEDALHPTNVEQEEQDEQDPLLGTHGPVTRPATAPEQAPEQAIEICPRHTREFSQVCYDEQHDDDVAAPFVAPMMDPPTPQPIDRLAWILRVHRDGQRRRNRPTREDWYDRKTTVGYVAPRTTSPTDKWFIGPPPPPVIAPQSFDQEEEQRHQQAEQWVREYLHP